MNHPSPQIGVWNEPDPLSLFMRTMGDVNAPSPKQSEGVTVGVFHLYMDETGTHDKGPTGVAILMGLMSTAQAWVNFNSDWSSVLDAAPSIPYWHTSKAHTISLRGQVRTMEPDEIKAKELALAGVLYKHRGCMAGLCIELSMADFAERVTGKVDLPSKTKKKLWQQSREHIENPIFVMMREALRHAVSMAGHWNEAMYHGLPFHVWTVFEESESERDNEFEFLVSHHILKRLATAETKKKIGPAIFMSGKGLLGQTTLQAADLYACSYHRACAGDARPAWKLLAQIPGNNRPITAERLSEIVTEVNEGEPFVF